MDDVATAAAQAFYSQKKKYFSSEKRRVILASLKKLNEEQINSLDDLSLRNPTVMLIISILFGELGVDRFMLGNVGTGILKLCTCGGFGIWWLIDLFTVMRRTREKNFIKVRDAVSFF